MGDALVFVVWYRAWEISASWSSEDEGKYTQVFSMRCPRLSSEYRTSIKCRCVNEDLFESPKAIRRMDLVTIHEH